MTLNGDTFASNYALGGAIHITTTNLDTTTTDIISLTNLIVTDPLTSTTSNPNNKAMFL